MNKPSRANLIMGILLVLIGVLIIIGRFIPGFDLLTEMNLTWPVAIIGVGVFLLLLGLLIGVPGMAVPACIVSGIGGILYWQNETGNWQSWSYLWALIPGFVGIGVIIMGILSGEWRTSLREGINTILVSLILLVIFWFFLGGSGIGWEYWPALLIIFGLWILVRQLFRRR